MYGLVNQAIKDLVISKFGEDKWDAICEKAQLSDPNFVSMQYYPDPLTYGLVGAATSVLGLPAEAILAAFGKHWVLYTAKEGYGPLMDLFGRDYKSCLQNLNNLHARMGMTMPKLSPPRFTFKEVSPQHYEVSYFSSREGLCPMVSGLLEGLAEKYKVQAQVQLKTKARPEDPHVFQILVQEA